MGLYDGTLLMTIIIILMQIRNYILFYLLF